MPFHLHFLFCSIPTTRNGSTDASNPANLSIEEKASLLSAKYSSKYGAGSSRLNGASSLKREDSTDDLMKSITLANSRREKRMEEFMKVRIQCDCD